MGWNRFSLIRVFHCFNANNYVYGNQVSSSSLHSAIPKVRVSTKFAKKVTDSEESIIDSTTIEHLERISLVDFANVRGIERLEEAIKLADIIRTVDTTGVEPMYSVLEEETLYLRPDNYVETNSRKELLSLSSMTEEEYYVAPQGNVPLSTQNTYDRE